MGVPSSRSPLAQKSYMVVVASHATRTTVEKKIGTKQRFGSFRAEKHDIVFYSYLPTHALLGSRLLGGGVSAFGREMGGVTAAMGAPRRRGLGVIGGREERDGPAGGQEGGSEERIKTRKGWGSREWKGFPTGPTAKENKSCQGRASLGLPKFI